jgi:hypothetical protein
MSVPANGNASRHFRFRFVARGETASGLVRIAARSLQRCHPNVEVLIIDANDTPMIEGMDPTLTGVALVLHVAPDVDEVSTLFGRGSRSHLYYWRHSPQLRQSLPMTSRYDVHADADLLFVRPMDLASLLRPLEAGRIAAAVDESTTDYYSQLSSLASTASVKGIRPPVVGGPLLQSGLLFSNPADDDGLYERFWKLAVDGARAGVLPSFPWDDMHAVSQLLGHGGPLWERLLLLPPGWNFITDARNDPGVFACVAHHGGRRAQAMLLAQSERLFPPGEGPSAAWGTVMVSDGNASAVLRGPWNRRVPTSKVPGNSADSGRLSVPLPCCLSWLVPNGSTRFEVTATIRPSIARGGHDPSAVSFFLYVDGRLWSRPAAVGGRLEAEVRVDSAETVTMIGTALGCDAHLEERFA